MDDALSASFQAVVLSRAAERVLLLAAGALAIYLGYRLFRLMPNVDQSEGKLELPGGVSIFLSRIGPGAFFALFGCAVIGYSVTRPVDLKLPTEIGSAIEYSSFGERSRPVSPVQEIVISGLDPELVVARLNGFLDKARNTLSRPEAGELEEAIRAAKFAVMLSGWKPEWGDKSAFARWAEENGDRDPPEDLVPDATVVFRTII